LSRSSSPKDAPNRLLGKTLGLGTQRDELAWPPFLSKGVPKVPELMQRGTMPKFRPDVSRMATFLRPAGREAAPRRRAGLSLRAVTRQRDQTLHARTTFQVAAALRSSLHIRKQAHSSAFPFVSGRVKAKIAAIRKAIAVRKKAVPSAYPSA